MKSLMLFTCCSMIIMFANSANAIYCDMSDCSVSISTDAGFTGKRCEDTGDCDCSGGFGGWFATGTSCGVGNCTVGFGFNGAGALKRCCVSGACPKGSEAAIEAQEKYEILGNRPSLGEVFADEMTSDGSRNVHYGYVDNWNKSPNAGRTTSAAARLDACLYYTDVDAIDALGGTNAQKHAYCIGSTYGCGTSAKNDYCNANGAAVCIDRCDCVYGQNTCENL